MEWTDDKVFKLIKLYESYPCVYDVACKEYTTKMLLIQGWVHNKRLLRAFFFNSNRRFTKFNTSVAAAQTSSLNSIFCVVCLQPVHVTG